MTSHRWVILFLLLLVGCSGGQEPAPVATVPLPAVEEVTPQAQPTVAEGSGEPTPPLLNDQVPTALLVDSEGASQSGAAGAYCWDFPQSERGGRTVCVDNGALLAPAEPLTVSGREPLSFQLDAGVPQLITLRVLEWQPSEEASGVPGTVALSPSSTVLANGDLEPGATAAWEAPEPGEYFLDVSAVFANGSISYGWHIVVEP